MPLCLRNLSPEELSGPTTLWRYASFQKFLDFLLMKRLYFRRIDKLTDPFECLMPPDLYHAAAGKVSGEAAAILGKHAQYIARERTKVFINSWHANEYESEAMWKLFGGAGHSIAVTAKLSSLIKALGNRGLTLGKVLYKDTIKDDFILSDIFDFALLKRKPFEHEREFRLLYINTEGVASPRLLDENGLHIPVEPRDIIESIYVSPLSEPWQAELTQHIVAGEGLADKVITSTLFGPVRPDVPRKKKSL